MFKLLVILAIVFWVKVESLTCNEGVNVTLFGLPFYHWNERECFGKSNCFTQELSLTLDVPVSIRYGGCISKYYASQFTCKKLFGNDSNFNPSILLNLVTDSDDFLESFAEDFRRNLTKHFTQLFTKGTGTVEFVEGIFSMCETMGLNMKAVRKLKQPITDYLSAFVTPPTEADHGRKYEANLKKQEANLIKAVGNVDTNQNVSPDKLYLFFRGISFPGHYIDDVIKASNFRLAVENGPRLLRSMFKDNDQALKWFDGGLNAMSKANRQNLTQTAIDVANEITKSVTMPTYGNEIIKYVTNSLLVCPGRVAAIRHASLTPCFNVLLKYGEPDKDTIALTDKVTALTKTLFFTNHEPLGLIKTTSDSLQTLFRTFVPIPTSEMNTAYLTLIDGFDSLNYTNINRSKRLEKTKMSEFLLDILQRTNPNIAASHEAVIINLSKTVYNAVTSKHTAKLDTFFTTLITEFKPFPKVDAGRIFKNLIENFGQTVPLGLKPLLDNLQPLIDSFINQQLPGRETQLTAALKNLVTDYQTAFPTSKFPQIAFRYLNFIEDKLVTFTYWMSGPDFSPCRISDPNYRDCMEGSSMKYSFGRFEDAKTLNSLEIDLFFAILETTGLTSDSYIKKALANNQTVLAAYARLLKSLDPDDVKELQDDYEMWIRNVFRVSDNYNFDNFILAINYTTDKIINKMTKVMKGLRYVHAPESCRHVTCQDKNCNTHDLINKAPLLTKAMMRGEAEDMSQEITTTPSGFALSVKSAPGLSITLVLTSFLMIS